MIEGNKYAPKWRIFNMLQSYQELVIANDVLEMHIHLLEP